LRRKKRTAAGLLAFQPFGRSAHAFTIAGTCPMSWIIRRWFYENDIPTGHLGQKAEIRLNGLSRIAFLTGSGQAILALVIDPQIRTAKSTDPGRQNPKQR